MAFTIANWTCVSSSLNQGQETVTPFGGTPTVLNAPNIFYYGSPNDTVATITGNGYFNAQIASLSVGDWIQGNGTDATFSVKVSSIAGGVVTVTSTIMGSLTPFAVSGNFFISPAQTGITAHAGGGQGAATALTYTINNVTTVASVADSVALPTSIAGMEVLVINDATNSMQVFGAGTDTIDDVATATGVAQLGKSVVLYTSPVAGKWYSLGLGLSFNAGGFPLSSVSNGLTAHAGGGQGSALPLVSSLNRITTVATVGDSVALPASVAGLSITVINNGANTMQVFGAGTDTINGVATATGVPHLPNSAVIYYCAVAGLWQAQSLPFGYSAAFPTFSAATSLTAHAGGGQASALQLAAFINNVTTVATAADSVKLPASAVGMEITVTNSGANTMQVYGLGTDTVNGITATTGVPQLAGVTTTYRCAASGNWVATTVPFLGFNQGVTNITAGTTQTQAGATAITSSIAVVTTGNSGDGIILPALSASLVGMRVQVINSSATPGRIYCPGTTNTNTIDGTAGATGVVYAASKTLFLVAISATAWVSTLSN